jgi:hypothetical protein
VCDVETNNAIFVSKNIIYFWLDIDRYYCVEHLSRFSCVEKLRDQGSQLLFKARKTLDTRKRSYKKKTVMIIIITEIVPMALSLWTCGTIFNNKLNDLYLIKFIY